jgi:hypothetical protein
MPWVPQALYAELVEMLRERRAPVVSPAPAFAPTVAASAPAPRESAPALPEPVLAACEHYAFGDPKSHAANLAVALRLQHEGQTPKAIVQAIRAGDRAPLVIA